MIDDETKEKAKRLVKDAGRWLWATNDALSALHQAREGSLLSKGLAAATIAGKAISMIFPDQTPRDQLLAKGYKPANVGLGSFFCARLMSSGPHKSVSLDGDDDSDRFVFWDAAGEVDAVAAVYRKDRWVDGPFLKNGKAELLAAAVEPTVWHGHDLMVGVGRSILRRDQEETLELLPMKPPGVYIGEPGVEWFVERLKRHGDETRSMLLVGPTGVGKSTLGRLIARDLVGGGRVLKISSQALKSCTAPDVVDLVTTLKPDVLLLDDVSSIDDHRRHHLIDNNQMLELLEALHGKAKLLVATLMSEPDQPHRYVDGHGDAEGGGSNYFSGMRPGRVDEVVLVKKPSPRVREEILRHYLGGDYAMKTLGVTRGILSDVVKRCDGLTGAYLGEVAHRFKVHGVKNYKSEIQSVLAAAPASLMMSVRAIRRSRRRRLQRFSKKDAMARRAKHEAEAKEKLKEVMKEAIAEVASPSASIPPKRKKRSRA